MHIKLFETFRITTFVPPDDVPRIIKAICKVDTLRYGKYTQVCWRSAYGIECFQSDPDANPTKGEPGSLEQVPSVKLEFSIARISDEHLHDVLLALATAHPWEEPVILVSSVRETRTTK